MPNLIERIINILTGGHDCPFNNCLCTPEKICWECRKEALRKITAKGEPEDGNEETGQTARRTDAIA